MTHDALPPNSNGCSPKASPAGSASKTYNSTLFVGGPLNAQYRPVADGDLYQVKDKRGDWHIYTEEWNDLRPFMQYRGSSPNVISSLVEAIALST